MLLEYFILFFNENIPLKNTSNYKQNNENKVKFYCSVVSGCYEAQYWYTDNLGTY